MEESSYQHCFFSQYAEADDGADMETNLTAIIRSAIREEQLAFYQVLTQQLAVQRLEQRQEQALLRQEVTDQFSEHRLSIEARLNDLETSLSEAVAKGSTNSSQVTHLSQSSLSDHATSSPHENGFGGSADTCANPTTWAGPSWMQKVEEAPSAPALDPFAMLALSMPYNPLQCPLCREPQSKKRRVDQQAANAQ